MNEPEKFLERWSRRKREAADSPTSDLPAPAEARDAGEAPTETPPPEDAAKAAGVPFDPASLPPIESITADSDIRAFLKPGVSPDLARAALRRAWSADLAIRDFIGLVENPWDFNNPHGVPGFGPLASGEDVGRLLAQATGTLPVEKAAPPEAIKDRYSPTKPQLVGECSRSPVNHEPALSENASVQRNENIAARNDSDDADAVAPARPRGHGGALPKL